MVFSVIDVIESLEATNVVNTWRQQLYDQYRFICEYIRVSEFYSHQHVDQGHCLCLKDAVWVELFLNQTQHKMPYPTHWFQHNWTF